MTLLGTTNSFDWVLLKAAGGNFEMNSIKVFFELNWVPFSVTYAV